MNTETKACPFCAETILATAIKCKHCGSMLDGTSDDATHNEEILADGVANLFRGIEGVGGRLTLTSRRVLFEPHAINLQRNPADILLSDIVEVRKRNTLGLIPNGLLIRTKAGVEYKFVLWDREKVMNLIESRIRKA
jgi:hypothetical protein